MTKKPYIYIFIIFQRDYKSSLNIRPNESKYIEMARVVFKKEIDSGKKEKGRRED